MKESSKATARVRITVEYSDCGVWGKDCSIGQVWDQARDAAIKSLETVLQEAGRAGLRFTIVGNAEVVAIVVPEGKP